MQQQPTQHQSPAHTHCDTHIPLPLDRPHDKGAQSHMLSPHLHHATPHHMHTTCTPLLHTHKPGACPGVHHTHVLYITRASSPPCPRVCCQHCVSGNSLISHHLDHQLHHQHQHRVRQPQRPPTAYKYLPSTTVDPVCGPSCAYHHITSHTTTANSLPTAHAPSP